MSVKTDEILEQLKSLSMFEAAELVKQIEETFGVDASPHMVRFPYVFDDHHHIVGDEPLDEFDVVLEEVPADKKLTILKEIRTLTGLGLKEAKDFVESAAPKVVKFAIARHAAEDVKQPLEAAGAKVSIKRTAGG